MLSFFALVLSLSTTPQVDFSESIFSLADEAATRDLSQLERALVAQDRLAALHYLRVAVRKPGAQPLLVLPDEAHPLLPALNSLLAIPDRTELSDEHVTELYAQHGLYIEDALAIATRRAYPVLKSLMRADQLVAGRSPLAGYATATWPTEPDAFLKRACALPFSDGLVMAFLERGEPVYTAFVAMVERWESDSKHQSRRYWGGCYKAGVSAMLGSDPRVLELPRERLDPRRFLLGRFDQYEAALDAGLPLVTWYADKRETYYLAWSGDFGARPSHNDLQFQPPSGL